MHTVCRVLVDPPCLQLSPFARTCPCVSNVPIRELATLYNVYGVVVHRTYPCSAAVQCPPLFIILPRAWSNGAAGVHSGAIAWRCALVSYG